MAATIILQLTQSYNLTRNQMEILNVKEHESSYLVNDEIWVPKDQNNRHHQEVQKWIADGGVVETEALLEEARLKKIAEIKSIRDQKNTEPLTNHQAFIIDDNGDVTAEESNFLFYTNRHQTNPTSDPASIISRVLELGAMPYFTKDTEGNKVVIELTPVLAAALNQSIATRNDSNYRICFAAETAIRNATTIEGIEAVTWNENI